MNVRAGMMPDRRYRKNKVKTGAMKELTFRSNETRP